MKRMETHGIDNIQIFAFNELGWEESEIENFGTIIATAGQARPW
jgi:hypothetical protein